MPTTNPLRVAIAGLGTIGSGVARIIEDHTRSSGHLHLNRVLEKNPEGKHAREWYQRFPELITDNFRQVVEDPEIEVIVETIGGTEFARTLVKDALNHGKHVVTANKDLIATHGTELTELARNRDRHLLFEASVAGAIPILRLLKDYFHIEDLEAVEGILNGTTNYILSEMEEKNIAFDDALEKAQELGFAEQDPTNDIKGFDARYKLVILTYLVTGLWFTPEEFQLEGIDHLVLPDFDYASRMGRRIKLVAHLKKENGQIQAYVLPMMLPKEDVLAKITGSTNVITLHGKHAEDITLIGKGAGSLPTASAIIADLNRIRRHPAPFPPPHTSKRLKLMPFKDYSFRHTLRFEVLDKPGIVGIIGQIFAGRSINIYALEQLPQYHRINGRDRETVIFSLTLEPCREGILQDALTEINTQDFMLNPVNVLRESV